MRLPSGIPGGSVRTTEGSDSHGSGKLPDGTFNYYSAEHDDIEVAVYGDRAEMTGKSRVLAEKRWPEECNKARKDCFQILACIMRGLS